MRSVILAVVLFCSVFAGATACPSGYAASIKISIPAQGSLSANLTNVPVPWIGDANMVGIVTSSVGNDVIFCDGPQGSSNLLSWENVSANFNSGTGAGEFWILVPTVSKTTTQDYYAYFGKSGASDQSCAAFSNCATTVWNNYMAVFHFGTAGSLSVADARGVLSPTNHSATADTGVIGGGAGFDGSTSYVDLASVMTPTVSNTISVEAWVNSTNFNQFQRIISNLTGSNFNGWELMFSRSGSDREPTLQTGSLNGLTVNWTDATGQLTGSTYTHLVGTMNGTGGAAMSIYINGALKPSGFANGSVGIGTSSVNANIGRWSGGASNYFAGKLDEVRVSSNTATQTADYIKNLYNSESAPASYWTDVFTPPATGSHIKSKLF